MDEAVWRDDHLAKPRQIKGSLDDIPTGAVLLQFQYFPLVLTRPFFSFSAFGVLLQSGASSFPFSSSSSPSSLVLCTVWGLCSAGE